MAGMVDIIVPSLGESVAEATIAKWHKKEGEVVTVDEILVELETEKVTLEVNAPASGILKSISKKEGEVVVNLESIGSIAAQDAATADTRGAISTSTEPSNNLSANSNANNPNNQNNQQTTAPLSPAVQKLVTENNINASQIKGSGKDGRLTKGDVLNVIETSPHNKNNSPLNTQNISNASAPQDKTSTSANNADSASHNNLERENRVVMSRLRKTIAQRLKDSQNTAAILTTFNEIDMSNVIALRQKYREEFEKKHGVKLGFMSFFVKAVVNALKQIPAVNAEIENDTIIYKNYYDIGVAVGTEQGLVVPVVRNSDGLSFAEVEQTIVNLSKKAREGKLSMQDLKGGTFSISNGGVYGSLLSTPIINPPQSGIIGLHKTQERPIAINGKVEIRPMMYTALSYDHRIIDGKEAVTFLIKVKEAIENPEKLLLNL